MRVFATALLALAASAIATSVEGEIIETVTEYTTICPVTAAESSTALPTELPASLPSGLYSMSTPIIISTVTRCSACTSSPVIPPAGPIVTPPVSPASSAIATTSRPVIPVLSNVGLSVPSGTSPVAPIFTGSASRAAAGAGAGLATLFGIVAYLL